jgi:hypothetical protein
MRTLAVALLALSTLTTGCAAMRTSRPSGGAQIQKTSSEDTSPTVTDHDTTVDGRADLGQR